MGQSAGQSKKEYTSWYAFLNVSSLKILKLVMFLEGII